MPALATGLPQPNQSAPPLAPPSGGDLALPQSPAPSANQQQPTADPIAGVMARIAQGESRGNPNARYGFPSLPGAMGPAGVSHALGTYQDEPGTWVDTAKQWMAANPGQPPPNFRNPADQYKVNAFLARKTYGVDQNGRNLDEAAKAGSVDYSRLAHVWPSLGRGAAGFPDSSAVEKVRADKYTEAANLNDQAKAAIGQIGAMGGDLGKAMERIRAAQEKAEQAQEATLEAIKKPPQQPELDAVKHLSGLATVVGILGGLFTKSPMRASINAAAAAMEAYNSGDQTAYKQSYDNWKCLAIDTPLPTPRGWTTIERIADGDILFDERGNLCVVTGVSEVKWGHNCLKITFDDGSSLVADEDHLWRTSDGLLRHSHELRAGLHTISVTEPLFAHDALLPIDPYVLGVWLGDGSSSGATIYAHRDDINEICEHLRESGAALGTISPDHPEVGSVYRVGILDLHVRLRENCLLDNKHIPSAYLRGSLSQRLALLQGLMDTDGHIPRPPNTQCSFYTSSSQLADGFAELIRSLGIKSKYLTRLFSHDGTTAYHFFFTAYPELPVFRLRRKLAILEARRHCRQIQKRSRRHKIVSITPIDSVPVKCIRVNSDSHLFLAGESMIPTHNTQTDMLFNIAKMQSENVRQVMLDEDLGLNERRALLDTTLRAAGLSTLADQARTQGDEAIVQWQDMQQKAQQAYQTHLDTLEQTASYREAMLWQKSESKWQVVSGTDPQGQPIQYRYNPESAQSTDLAGNPLPFTPTGAAKGGVGAAAALSPATLSQMADQYLAGDKSVLTGLGYGNVGAQNRAALRDAITAHAQAQGMSGRDIATALAEYQGLTSGERSLGTRTATMGMAVSEAKQLIPQVLQTSEKVARSQYPTLNRVLLAAEQGTGSEDVIKLGIAVNSFINVYARAISPTGVPTVSDKDHARELLAPYWSNGQIAAGMDQILKELEAASQAPGVVREEFRESGRTRVSQPEIGFGGTPAAPKPGDVEQGYRFKGGDPADPNNWEKQ